MKEQPDNQLSPQELLERDQKLLEALCVDYTAVYYCNLAKNTMEPIKRSVHYTTFSGGTTVEHFKHYLKDILLPHLNGNSVLVMDNMKSHHAKAVKNLLDSSGIRYTYLPPYSPDLNPIEKLWSKVKSLLRKFKARSLDALPNAIQHAFQNVSPSDCSGWFRSCGYVL